MDPNSRERRPGAVDRINSAVNTARNIQTAFKVGRTAMGAAEVASTSEIWIPVAIAAAVILIIVFVILLGSGTGSALELGQQPTPGISSGSATLSPPSGGIGSNPCTQQYEGTGYCAVSNLMQYFGNDSTKALIASLICQAESGSDPTNLNDNCGTNDYSVGLFQINAVAHCPGAYGNLSCNNLLDVRARDVCENNWYNPVNNINFAVDLSNNGVKWTDWSTWLNPGKNPAVKEILTKCGISY